MLTCLILEVGHLIIEHGAGVCQPTGLLKLELADILIMVIGLSIFVTCNCEIELNGT